MDKNVLKNDVKKIKMPEETRNRMVKNCTEKIVLEKEKERMKTNIRRITWKKPLIVAAAMAVCLCFTSVTALAATGKLQGYFRNITNWNGAVTGTSYEQATEEMQVNITEVTEVLSVLVTMDYPERAPYRELEELSIHAYEILDANGTVVRKDGRTEAERVADGQAVFEIPMEELPEGVYKLVISSFEGTKKADQPLGIHGEWECEFER